MRSEKGEGRLVRHADAVVEFLHPVHTALIRGQVPETPEVVEKRPLKHALNVLNARESGTHEAGSITNLPRSPSAIRMTGRSGS